MAALITTIAGGRRKRRLEPASRLLDPFLCTLVADTVVRTPTAPPKPAYLDPVIDPTYGTTITRIAGDPGTAIGSTGRTWPTDQARHGYSKRQVWNADESLMRLERVGTMAHVYLDGQSYEPLFLQSAGGDSRWHPTIPERLVVMTGTGPVIRYRNVLTDTIESVMTIEGYTGCTFGAGEGNLSHDGDWLAVQGTRTVDSKLVIFAVHIPTETKYPDIDLAAAGFESVDWASISPMASYIVANGQIVEGKLNAGGFGDHTQVFDLEGNPVGDPWLAYGRPSHYDLTISVSGDEVAVGETKSSPGTGRMIMRRLSDGAETYLNSGGFPTHTSTRAVNIPWAYVSHPSSSPSYPPYHDELFMCHLSSNQTIFRLCSLHADLHGYIWEPHASVSPSGTRIVFASNWRQTGVNNVPQSYVCDLRAVCGI
jgi:hypothetical protein